MKFPETTKTILRVAFVVALVASACGGGDTDSFDNSANTTATTATAAPTSEGATTTTLAGLSLPPTVPASYEDFRQQTTACGAEPPPAATSMQFPEPEDLGLDPDQRLIATINTSCGPIVAELDPGFAPETVNSFVFLAREGYFDGTVSHRVLPGFVIQAGDPTATGLGGPGYVIPDELPPEGFPYQTGVLAMANAGANTTGSQFFIMVGDSGLPPLYSVYGVVIDGFDTLTSIVNLPLGTSARGETSVPLETVYIESITVEPAS